MSSLLKNLFYKDQYIESADTYCDYQNQRCVGTFGVLDRNAMPAHWHVACESNNSILTSGEICEVIKFAFELSADCKVVDSTDEETAWEENEREERQKSTLFRLKHPNGYYPKHTRFCEYRRRYVDIE